MVQDDGPGRTGSLEVVFDDRRAASDAGIVLVAALAQRLGIEALAALVPLALTPGEGEVELVAPRSADIAPPPLHALPARRARRALRSPVRAPSRPQRRGGLSLSSWARRAERAHRSPRPGSG